MKKYNERIGTEDNARSYPSLDDRSAFNRAMIEIANASPSESRANGPQTREIDLALAALGTGSAQEMKSRIFTNRITVLSPEHYSQALASVPEPIRKHQVSQGKLLRRVEGVLASLLELHGRSNRDRLQLFLFHDDVPLGAVWRGCLLLVSDGLAEPLSDGELAGIIAHELGHSYFEDEMAAAQKVKDASAMRVLELKCDGVAILSLKLLGHAPTLHMQALRRIQTVMKGKGLSSSIFQSHPDLVDRDKVLKRLIKSIG